MAKVLLVEDDNNLREIYQARLMAEGYEIVTAQNGEEALVVAKQQKPDLIISDVMMPRISGFEMLDILRNTAELKGTKVIMLTALGQADDQQRANSLGADKYLVKSQVTLEDIVNAAKELLTGETPTATPTGGATSAVAPAAPNVPAIAHVADNAAPAAPPAPAATETVAPATPAEPAAAVTPAPAAAPVAPVPTPASPQPTSQPLVATEPAVPAPTPALSPAAPAAPPVPPAAPAATDPTETTPIEQPVAVEPEPPQTPAGPTAPAVAPAPGVVSAAATGLEAEEKALQDQIASYNKPAEGTPPAPSQDGTAASNDAALADAVKQLNDAAAMPPEPPQPPSAVKTGGQKVIAPLGSEKPDLDALVAKEEAASTAPAPAAEPPATPPAAAADPGAAKPFDPNSSL